MSRPVSLPRLFVAPFLVAATATRLALLGISWTEVQRGLAAVPGILLRGLGADLVVAAYLALVLLGVARLVPRRWTESLGRGVGLAFGGWVFGLLFLAAAEVTFWLEFESRFNFIAVDYLVYTQEVIGNIFESYPMGWILGGLGALTALVVLATQGWWRRVALDGAVRTDGRLILLGAAACLLLLPRTHELADRYARELAQSGVASFVRAYWNNYLDYDTFYPTLPEPEVHERLAHLVPNRPDDPEHMVLHQIPAGAEKRWNVVVVLVESLGAEFLGTLGCPMGLTPKLDALANESWFFSRMYACGTRTVRGLEAVTLGIPPTPGNSLVRQPGNENMRSIAWPFRARGYDVQFRYGGYGYFDNMNYFCAHNGFDVHDRADLPPEDVRFGNVWGVCDQDLYQGALKAADSSAAAGRPFFQLVLTTSNHRPYTFPEVPGLDLPSNRAGAVRYSDHAVGEFLAQARTRPWFDDTVFVILGDHGASSAGSIDVPVNRYQIPCFVYAPKLVKARRDGRLVSQMDLAPTLLGMLGFGSRSSFFGMDLARRSPERALVSTYQALGLYRDDRLTLLRPRQPVASWDVADLYHPVPRTPDPEDVADTIAYYQGASAARRHGELSLAEPGSHCMVASR